MHTVEYIMHAGSHTACILYVLIFYVLLYIDVCDYVYILAPLLVHTNNPRVCTLCRYVNKFSITTYTND